MVPSTGEAGVGSGSARQARWPLRIAVGRVVKPHGVRGEVSIEPWGELGAHVRSGAELWLKDRRGSARRLLGVRGAKDRLIGTVEDCADRDLAESLRGAVLEIPSTTLEVPAEGEFYLFELEGCEVRTASPGPDNFLGSVRQVVEDGGGLLLEITASAVATEAQAVYLVPFVSAYLESMDFDQGVLVFDLPEGLLDTCVSTF